MRNAYTQPLPPLKGFIEIPDAVIELGDTESAYMAWESALREQDDFPDTVPTELT